MVLEHVLFRRPRARQLLHIAWQLFKETVRKR